jgi:hypothetical protein
MTKIAEDVSASPHDFQPFFHRSISSNLLRRSWRDRWSLLHSSRFAKLTACGSRKLDHHEIATTIVIDRPV